MNNTILNQPPLEKGEMRTAFQGPVIHTGFSGGFRWVWLATLVIVFLVQAWTLGVLPHMQQDEAQITDYGRLALQPHSDWSVTWLTARDKPLLLWTYLGPLIAEIGYQLGGGAGLGPRIASLLGGLFAATMAIGWLFSRRVPPLAAWCLGVAFLLDPMFDLSQRMARVDSWVFGCCIGACWLLRKAAAGNDASERRRPLIVAGMLAATAPFLWPSAIFLYPLIVVELIHLLSRNRAAGMPVRVMVLQVVVFLISGVVTACLLVIPVWNNLQVIFADMSSVVAMNVKSSSSSYERLFVLFDYHPWAKLVKAFVKTLSPLFPLLAIAGILVCRDKLLTLAAFIALAAMLATLVYEFRALYLLPYFVALAAGPYARFHRYPPSLLMRRLANIALVGIAAWSIFVSLGMRTYFGLQAKTPLSRVTIEQAARSSIGAGEYKVFLAFTYEFYFAGRSLGWHLYTPYIQFGYDSLGNWTRENDYEPRQQFENLLTRMDFAIFSKGSMTTQLGQQLATAGLRYSSTVMDTPGKENPSSGTAPDRNSEAIFWFLRGKTSYGPFVIYKRPQLTALDLPANAKTTRHD